MKLLWVKSKLPLSKLIMWGLNEPCSHFAIMFDDKIVFHSNLTGLHIVWAKSFLKSYDVVFEMNFDMPLEREEEMYQGVIDAHDGASYDYGAFAYFFWRAVLKKFFGKPLPEHNPWGSKDKFLCDEVVQLLPDEICPPSVKAMDLSMKSPYQVWLLLNNKPL